MDLSKLLNYWIQDTENQSLMYDLLSHVNSSSDKVLIEEFVSKIPTKVMSDPQSHYAILNTLILRNFVSQSEYLLSLDIDINTGPQGVFFKALCKFIGGDLDAAQQILDSAYHQAGLNIDSFTLLARILYLKGEIDEAKGILNSLSEQSDEPELLGLLSLVEFDLGNYEQALALSETTVKKDNTQVDALLALASVKVALLEVPQGNEVIDHCLKVAPQLARAWAVKGQVDFLKGEFEAALESFNKAFSNKFDHVGTYHMSGWCHLILGNIDASERDFNTALALSPAFSETYGALAVININKGDVAAAEHNIKKSLRLDKNSLTGLYAQSLMDEKNGDVDKAKSQVEAIIAMPSHIDGISYAELIKAVAQNSGTVSGS
ncbi:tetratricopeptide repeat protein [Pseudoalteromonas sp. SMS1]|uniref:tetratricopeptide repeat protein n=1 Tax=Pseudoalteromonas sp. SMS1 TaxID=2908894 RepID=UPI001F4329DC|nr:tetratricopeptide repeat protein [Pseudoalteromonas sp. SMS1]MCF2860209.1 tetratricopeptide repeat protein [Pseudoalteromonas sp. SMS1]